VPGDAGRLTGIYKVPQASQLAVITQAGSLPAGGGATGDPGGDVL